jgi:hypothetical protein
MGNLFRLLLAFLFVFGILFENWKIIAVLRLFVSFGNVHIIRNTIFWIFRPPPFVTKNRTNPYTLTRLRNKSLTPPKSATYYVDVPFLIYLNLIFPESKEWKGFERFLIFENLCGFLVVVFVWFCLDVWRRDVSDSVVSGSNPIKISKYVLLCNFLKSFFPLQIFKAFKREFNSY